MLVLSRQTQKSCGVDHTKMTILPPTPHKELDTHFGNDHITLAPPKAFSNINFKQEILDDDHFCMDNNLPLPQSYLQDFHNLNDFPLLNQDIIEIHDNCFDTVDPSSSADFSLYEFDRITAVMQELQGAGFFNFPDGGKDSLMKVETTFMYSKPLSIFAPNESSCVTADKIGCRKRDGSKRSKKIIQSASTRKCVRGQKKCKSAKGQWTIEEDRVLTRLVDKYGERKWSSIAQMLKGRIGKQCRERWHNHLRPDIKKDVWSEEEDRVLIEIHARVGNKWAEIAKSLPGRTENSIKNHWNATKRRQFSRRNCRSKWPKPSSLLQNYIKSLNFDRKSGSISKTTPPPTTSNDITVSASENRKIEYHPDGHIVPEYVLDDIVSEFTFDDHYHLFKDSGCVDSLMDDIHISEIGDNDVELSFEMPPPLMQCDMMVELESSFNRNE